MVFEYIGYVSVNNPEYCDRRTSCDPATSNGAAYGPERRML